jgi:hypothetical protein
MNTIMTWQAILDHCKKSNADNDIDLSTLFVKQTINTSSARKNKRLAAWWLKKDIVDYKNDLVDHLTNHPHTQGPIQPNMLNRGQLVTLEELMANKHDQDKCIAILLCAALFPVIWSCRKRYDKENWPKISTVKNLGRTISNIAFEDRCAYPWRTNCSDVLPLGMYEYFKEPKKLATQIDVINYCIEEYQIILKNYQLINLKFINEPVNKAA